MNAFKKELAAKLLDDTQLDRAMEQVVNDIDDVFENKTRQERQDDNYSSWYTFIAELAGVMVDKLVSKCIFDNQEPDKNDEAIMQLVVLLDAAAGTNSWEVMLGNTNDAFEDRFMKIKCSLMVA